jgi:hypothetical protein
MAQKVYSLFMAKNTEAWYQLSQEEQDGLMAKMGESLKELGVKPVVLCDSSWSSEQWRSFGVLEFPDIEAVQKHRADMNNLDWSRYFDSVTMLGSEWPEA